MGSKIEFNDTLKLKRNAGFPPEAKEGERYSFSIEGRRLYHLTPVRVFLVEEVAGKWNFVGQAQILELTIDAVRDETRGTFQVSKVYPREYAWQVNRIDAPNGLGMVPEET